MDDNLRRMKANPGDKLVKKSCETCEFNFGNVCAGYGKRTDNGNDLYGKRQHLTLLQITLYIVSKECKNTFFHKTQP